MLAVDAGNDLDRDRAQGGAWNTSGVRTTPATGAPHRAGLTGHLCPSIRADCSFPIWGSASEAARMPIVLVLGRPDFSLRCELSALAMAADALLPLLGCRLVARAGEDADARLGHGPNAGIRVRRQHLLEGVQDRLVPD